MSDDSKSGENRKLYEGLKNWGIDLDRFFEQLRTSSDATREDLSEQMSALRQQIEELSNRGDAAGKELLKGVQNAWEELRKAAESAEEAAEGDAPGQTE